MFRMKIDLRFFNVASTGESWTLLSIETQMPGFCKRKQLSSIELCAGYLKRPFNPESYDPRRATAPKRSFVFTKVLHGLRTVSG